MPAPRSRWARRTTSGAGDAAPKPASAQPKLEDIFYQQLATLDAVPLPQRQVRFHPTRRYLLDFGWAEIKLGIEIEGGIWAYAPSHTSAAGIKRDIDKHNLAIEQGWTVLRADSTMVKSGEALNLVERLYGLRRGAGDIDTSDKE